MKHLDELERWFQGEIARPHEGRTRPKSERRAAASTRILPSQHLAPEERVAIYADMYFARLLECLAVDYPAVKALLGPIGFEKLTRAYLREHPSRHWNLNVLGRTLPEFLAGDVKLPRKALVLDVARIERAMSVVFDEAPSRVLTSADVAKLSPEVWAGAKPRLVPALELLELAHHADAVVTAVRQEKPMPSLRRAKSFLVVWRKEFVVWRMEIDEPAFRILRALHAGRSLAEAIGEGARAFRGTPEELQALISRSFGEWIAEGFFASIGP